MERSVNVQTYIDDVGTQMRVDKMADDDAQPMSSCRTTAMMMHNHFVSVRPQADAHAKACAGAET